MGRLAAVDLKAGAQRSIGFCQDRLSASWLIRPTRPRAAFLETTSRGMLPRTERSITRRSSAGE